MVALAQKKRLKAAGVLDNGVRGQIGLLLVIISPVDGLSLNGQEGFVCLPGSDGTPVRPPET